MTSPTPSFWLTHSSPPEFHSAEPLPTRSQVVVIGGGLTGVSTAYWLRRYGIDVTLLERRALSGGATGRNGGHLVPGPAENFADAVRRHGPETARAIWDFTLKTTEAIQAFVAEHEVDCDLSLGGTAILALHPDELPHVQKNAELLTQYGIAAEYWDAAACAGRTHSDHFLGGLFFPFAGQLWPAKLVFAIAEQAARLGAIIHSHTNVMAVENLRVRSSDFYRSSLPTAEAITTNAHGRLIVKTDRGEVRARAVVYATNAWARQLIPWLEKIIVPVRGQVIVTEPATRLWPFGLVANFGYEYWIQRPDGRIVLGGMRWRSPMQEVNNDDDGSLDPNVSAGLRKFLPSHFPALRGIEVEQEWTGIMGYTPDFNPLVGPLPNRPGEYIAAGFSGHGMPLTFYAGKALAEMVAGRTPEVFVEAFLPDRFL